jgi:DNA polymerase III delta prime subunit
MCANWSGRVHKRMGFKRLLWDKLAAESNSLTLVTTYSNMYLFFGRMTLLLGPPGSGKTTLLLALAGKLSKSLKVSSYLPFLSCWSSTDLMIFWRVRVSFYDHRPHASVLWSQQPNGNLEATVIGTCFLLHGQSLSIGEFQVHWKYVISHVRNSGNPCSHEKKDKCHNMVSHNLTHISHSSFNWSVLDQ